MGQLATDGRWSNLNFNRDESEGIQFFFGQTGSDLRTYGLAALLSQFHDPFFPLQLEKRDISATAVFVRIDLNPALPDRAKSTKIELSFDQV